MVFEVFLLVLILAGNIAVLAVIIVEGQKSRMHFFIKNLAVAGTNYHETLFNLFI
jgi:hypothetical protein